MDDEGSPWFWILVVVMTVGLLFVMVYHVSFQAEPAPYAVQPLESSHPPQCLGRENVVLHLSFRLSPSLWHGAGVSICP